MDDVEGKDLILAGEIFKSLTKTLKTFKAYPPNNPIYQKFAAELLEKFNAFFEMQDTLPLTVDQFSLLLGGKDIFHSEDRTDNVALMLFVDGIREICFHKGINIDELISFVDIFKAVSEGQNLDDDVVTLLWEKNPEHITYSVSEGFIEEEMPVESELLMEEAGDELAPIGAMYKGVVLSPSAVDFKVLPASPEELNVLQNEIQKLDGDGLLFEATDLFLELMRIEKDTEVFKELAKNIGKIADIFFEKNSIEKVTEILGRLKDVCKPGIYLGEYLVLPGCEKIIDEVIDGAGSEEKLRKLFSGGKSLESIQIYLLFLNKNAIPSILNILGETEDRKMRRNLCNILSVLGKDSADAFVNGVRDKRWYLVRNTLMVLGNLKESSAIKCIEETLTHPELRVRREAVRALELIGAEETKGPLMIALRDNDAGIRTAALKALRRFKDKKLFDVAKERISAGDLKDRPFTEKKELFETLAETGGEAAFPMLSGFFEKKGLFRKAETEELRACAAYGLGILGTKDSVALLEKGMREKEGFVSAACKKARMKAGAG